MNLLNIFLVEGTSPTGTGASPWSSILMMVAIVGIFYFFMIRPQQKKQKEIKTMREAMKVGDKVVTSGGIYGKIREMNDTTFTIEIADNVRIKVDKASVFATANDIQTT
ncbi:MAG: preprotein translocase subunit YajC [Candidatus Azobacteroides sp.]|nr:preprotein translocase subunit YajC [Candidatus Azobacteroides sp.]